MDKQVILLFIVLGTLCINADCQTTRSQFYSIARGQANGELYISTSWFADVPAGVRWGIFHSTDNGEHISPKYSNLEIPPEGEMSIGTLLCDATPGVLYNISGHTGYDGFELWVSFDYGVNWEYREDYNGYASYFSGVNPGVIIRMNNQGVYKSIDYGLTFEFLSSTVNCAISEVGFLESEFFGIGGDGVDGFQLTHTLDYGVTYTEFPIDSTVSDVFWPKISRGTEEGELYMVSRWPYDTSKIFYSIDTGFTWTQQSESYDFEQVGHFAAGQEPGSFYVKRSTFSPAHDHIWLYIDYSSDYGVTFTTYFHDLVPTFTSINPTNKQDIKLSNYPNPFAKTTTIIFELPENCKTPLLNIYNIHGKLIWQYNINGKKLQQWDRKDGNGNLLPNGVYLYNITYDNSSSPFHKLIVK